MYTYPGRKSDGQKPLQDNPYPTVEIIAQPHHHHSPTPHVQLLIPTPTNEEDVQAQQLRSHVSPFTPNVGGTAIGRRASGGLGKAFSATPASLSPTPPGSEAGAVSGSTRRQKPNQDQHAAPEKELTLFAVRLAVLEKVASNVGTLGFIWATVVLLGGYAITLKEIDFWFVTVILVIEGARIFSRSHELEWQHQDAGVFTGVSLFSRAYRKSSDVFFKSTRYVLGRRSSAANEENNQNPNYNTRKSKQDAGPTGNHSTASHGELHELQSSSKGHDANHYKLSRTWSSSRVPLMPFLDHIFQAKYISRFLYWLQLVAAMVAIALCVYRFKTHDFARASEVDTGSNHTSALFIFYSLACFEALVFLLERSYWQFQISVMRILSNVNTLCGLQEEDITTTRRFFYDVYSKCLNDSIFEGLKMDMVEYALTWLHSDSPAEQLGGLRVLLSFCSRKDGHCAEETLRSVGVKQGALERLLEMVTWKNPEEYGIRKAAAELLSKLVKSNRYSVRVAAISGSIEGIFSLLSDDQYDSSDKDYVRQGAAQPIAPVHLQTHMVGLRILRNLAKDPLNCARIGVTRGLLARLVSFIDASPAMLRHPDNPDKIALVKKSLELLSLLSGATGHSGKMLREEISKIVYTFANLRCIHEYGHGLPMVQDVATEILCCLAMDDDVREIMGDVGGLMKTLFGLMAKKIDIQSESKPAQVQIAKKAGETLALLALKSKKNCIRMMRLQRDAEMDMVAALMELVTDWEMGAIAMNILRSFCAYSEDCKCRRRIVKSECARKILRIAVIERSGRMQEAALGLLAKLIARQPKFEEGDENAENVQKRQRNEGGGDGEEDGLFLYRVLDKEQMSAAQLAERVARILERYALAPATPLPRIRRFCVELAMALVEYHPPGFLPHFHNVGFRGLLYNVAESASELENYATFSGATGVTLHSMNMASLLDKAIDKFSQSITSC